MAFVTAGRDLPEIVVGRRSSEPVFPDKAPKSALSYLMRLSDCTCAIPICIPPVLSTSCDARLNLPELLLARGCTMSEANRVLCLRIALIVIGIIFIFGIYPLSIIWPSGWAWGQGHSHYLMMIIGIYATLGVFLLIASRDPDAHKSIIWFTVWSSVVHGAIMAWQAFSDAGERGHLLADVPALFLIAIVLGVLLQMGSSDRVTTATATG